jgi:drug/metabolite transporter (DMT)-like permease
MNVLSSELAMLVMLLSATVMSFSSIVLKIAATKMPAMEGNGLAKNFVILVKNGVWIFGFLLSVSALGLNTFALANADMSLIQPLSGFGLIVLVVAARVLLGEVVTRREVFGVLLAIAGVVVVGISASSVVAEKSLATIDLISKPMAVLWLLLLIAGVIVSWLLCRAFNYRGAGLVFAANTAIASTLGLTFSKVFFSDLSRPIGVGPLHYVFLALFLAFASGALLLQQFALQKGRAVVVVPVINMMQVAVPIPTGLLVFRENTIPMQWAGLAILLIGVLILSVGSKTGATKS